MAKKVLSDELIEQHLDILSETEYSQDFSSAQSDNDLAKNRKNLYQMNGVGDSENEPTRYEAFTSANCSTFLDENINEESTNPQPIIAGPSTSSRQNRSCFTLSVRRNKITNNVTNKRKKINLIW
ncbi:unnamed protein product [Danaus chrysippus]|uniref:(African queen) hypothetical protein n=1 Tax=Danaus chrysippus TaxID=151541 RepID=A0A8J2W6J1_9NEOP|nr:unnamed protein product [Danaus chrysippus]